MTSCRLPALHSDGRMRLLTDRLQLRTSSLTPPLEGVDLRRKILTQRQKRYHQLPPPLPPPRPPPAPAHKTPLLLNPHSGSSSGSPQDLPLPLTPPNLPPPGKRLDQHCYAVSGRVPRDDTSAARAVKEQGVKSKEKPTGRCVPDRTCSSLSHSTAAGTKDKHRETAARRRRNAFALTRHEKHPSRRCLSARTRERGSREVHLFGPNPPEKVLMEETERQPPRSVGAPPASICKTSTVTMTSFTIKS
uniref:Uncharacterized protein n=1 Tax=Sphaerodactylus townsendi TaxID=933632 RepID=A0ACB8EVX4_9SAUR